VVYMSTQTTESRIVAWLRRKALEGGLKISPEDFDDLRSHWIDAQDGPNIVDGDPWDAALRAAADAIERCEHEQSAVTGKGRKGVPPSLRPANPEG
jgi:hypothetical protein